MKRHISSMVSILLLCSECNGPFAIMRKKNKRKKAGHIKHLYCLRCRKVTARIDTNNDGVMHE